MEINDDGRTINQLLEDLETLDFKGTGGPLTGYPAWQLLKKRLAQSRLGDLLAMVKRFNRDIIGLDIPDKPTLLSGDRATFRLNHLAEEMSEIRLAIWDSDLPEVVDGLIDLAYVALGTLIEMGVTPGAAFEEVHRANMDKKRGEKAERPGSLGYDAIKPEGWQPPDLAPYLTITRKEVLQVSARNPITIPSNLDKRFSVNFAELEEAPSISLTAIPQPLLSTPLKSRPKILVIGHARHGKDTVSEMLSRMYGLTFTSSSLFMAERLMMPIIGSLYETVQECFEDRGNHREVWFKAFQDFNRPDATAIARPIIAEYDIYNGVRSATELHACRNAGLFDRIIWVDRSEHLPLEDRSSCTVEPWMADYVLDNNGSLEDLEFNLVQLMGAPS